MKLGTRGSQLALWQANAVKALLEAACGEPCEIVVIRTTGDEAGTGLGPGGSTLAPGAASGDAAPTEPRPAAHAIAEVDGARDRPLNVKRLFVKELEEALLDGRIDAAVHSSKDMPSELPPGLTVGAALAREDPRDALLLPRSRPAAGVGAVVDTLGPRPRIGTSSIRRVAQLRAVFPHASFADVRGNLDTRLRKLDAGEYDALVLAAAGLRRLGHVDRISWAIPVDRLVPAPGQGIIAVEQAAHRTDAAAALALINDRAASDALAAERAVVHALGGGCQMPIGTLAEVDDHDVHITGIVIAPDGSHAVRQHTHGSRRDAAAVGVALAEALLRAGAGAILDAVRQTSLPPHGAP